MMIVDINDENGDNHDDHSFPDNEIWYPWDGPSLNFLCDTFLSNVRGVL